VRIGELARAAGVGVETVRFYERRGLLPASERTVSGYRTYGAEDLERLRFIRRAKALGFELREIGELLALREDDSTSCGEVRRRAAAKVADLERRVAEVDAIRRALVRLAAECSKGGASGPCPLLRHLAEETQEA
jgi:MerR family mercuric resistance operon transcriptional regulator